MAARPPAIKDLKGLKAVKLEIETRVGSLEQVACIESGTKGWSVYVVGISTKSFYGLNR